MIVVGLTGFARSGKDTVADHLVNVYGFEKMSFATPLKNMVRKLDPIIEGGDYINPPQRMSDLEGLGYTEDQIKAEFPEWRRLLQVLGTDCIRAIDEDFWLKAMAKEIGKREWDAKIVVPDMRFGNEADMIREGYIPGPGIPITNHPYEGVTFSVERHGCEPANGHISDLNVKFISTADTISNNGTLEELYQTVDCLLEEWGIA